MSQTTQQKKKALVLKAFDALFNRRDDDDAEQKSFGSPEW
jgi:hypothetical protein